MSSQLNWRGSTWKHRVTFGFLGKIPMNNQGWPNLLPWQEHFGLYLLANRICSEAALAGRLL
jgi:hypothetical protein